jgi:hypothetical protein
MRGENKMHAAPGRDSGEIAPLDADNLDNFKNRASSGEAEVSFGDPKDDHAIKNIIEKLKKTPSGQGKDSDQLQDQAIELYNRFCELIQSNKAKPEQITQAAQLFDEDRDELLERLS